MGIWIRRVMIIFIVCGDCSIEWEKPVRFTYPWSLLSTYMEFWCILMCLWSIPFCIRSHLSLNRQDLVRRHLGLILKGGWMELHLDNKVSTSIDCRNFNSSSLSLEWLGLNFPNLWKSLMALVLNEGSTEVSTLFMVSKSYSAWRSFGVLLGDSSKPCSTRLYFLSDGSATDYETDD